MSIFLALAFGLVDLALSLAACLSGHSVKLRGYPYFASCVAAAVIATIFAFRGFRSFDRVVFLRASGEEYGR